MSEQTVLVRSRPGETRIARIDDKSVLVDFAVYRDGSDGAAGLVGEVFLGRVRRVVPAMEAAFVDIAQGKDAFLGLSDARIQPHFGPDEAGDKISDHVHEGQAVMVQVLIDARETKGAKITMRVNITGDMIVFSPGGGGSARVSSRIKNKAERKRLLGLAEKMLEGEHTIIVRSAAEGADEKDLTVELESLKNKWAQLSEMSSNAKAPEHLPVNENALEKYLKDTGRKSVTRILSDDASFDGCEHFSTGDGDIFKKFNIADQVAGLLGPVVALKSGGSIIIEETAALTAIDVNSGGAGGSARELALSTNMEAVVEAARHIRLRNMAGVIVIDLMAMRSKDSEKKVVDAMRRALSDDPARPRLHGITSTGLLEITRPRKRPPLSNILCAPCAECPSGRGLSALSIGLGALDAVLTEVRSSPALMPTLVAHPDVIKALEQDAPGALSEMETRLGQPLELLPDGGLKKGSFRVDAAQR